MSVAEAKGLLSKEHFSVDGTLIQAWASHKSFRRKDGSDDQRPQTPGRNVDDADWKGRPRSNQTHESTTDPDARLFKKSTQTSAILGYLGHVLMENRSGLGVVVTHADGKAERNAALAMLDQVPGKGRETLDRDKNYDTKDFVAACRQRWVTPHLAVFDTRRHGKSTIDARTMRHDSYAASQVLIKRIEEHFGWGKTVRRICRTFYRSLRRVDQHFKLTMTAKQLIAAHSGAQQPHSTRDVRAFNRSPNRAVRSYFNSLLGVPMQRSTNDRP